MWDPYAEFEKAVLPNGLTVYVSTWPGQEWESVGFLVHSGAEHDPVGREGLAHFVEHVVSHNAPLPKKEIKEFFGKNGGAIDFGSTYYAGTTYGFFVPAKKDLLKQSFDLMGSMLFSADLSRCIESERQVILGEFNFRYPEVFKMFFRLHRKIHKALYSGYWLERFTRPLGEPKSIKAITRADLQSFYCDHYTPHNTSLVCVGGMSLTEIMEILKESSCVVIKEGKRTRLPVPVGTTNPPKESLDISKFFKGVYRLIRKVGYYTSEVVVPVPVKKSAMNIAILMLNKLLNEEVRERRSWTYHISASYTNHRHFFSVRIACGALARHAMSSIDEVVENCILQVGVREDLFEESKHEVALRNTVIDMSGNSLTEKVLNHLMLYSRIRTLSEINEEISSVTMEDIRTCTLWLAKDRRLTISS